MANDHICKIHNLPKDVKYDAEGLRQNLPIINTMYWKHDYVWRYFGETVEKDTGGHIITRYFRFVCHFMDSKGIEIIEPIRVRAINPSTGEVVLINLEIKGIYTYDIPFNTIDSIRIEEFDSAGLVIEDSQYEIDKLDDVRWHCLVASHCKENVERSEKAVTHTYLKFKNLAKQDNVQKIGCK